MKISTRNKKLYSGQLFEIQAKKDGALTGWRALK